MVCLVVVLSTTALPCLRESRSTLPPSSSSSSWTRGESGVGGGACVRSDREGGRRGGRVGDRAPSGVSAAAYLRVHVQDLHHVSDEVRELLVHLDLLHVLLHLLLVALQVEREAVALVPQDANLVLEQARAHGDVLHRRSLQLLEHPLGVPVVIEHAVEIHRARAREASAPRSGVPRGRRGDEAKANSNGNKKPTATDGMRGGRSTWRVCRARSKFHRRQTPACRTRAERRVVVFRHQTRARWRRSFARASCAAAPPVSRWTTGGTPRA